MNNSKLAIDNVSLTVEDKVDRTSNLREQESELIIILDALDKVQKSKEWSSLKEKVFDKLPVTLAKELQEEARKDSPDALKLNRLAGQLKWAEKYSDLSKLGQFYRLQLTNIRKQLYGKTQENS